MTFCRLFPLGMIVAFFAGNTHAQNPGSAGSGGHMEVIDIRAYGARAGASSADNPALNPTATIASRSKIVTVTGNAGSCQSSSTCWIEGDWVLIYKAGPAHLMTTPKAPTVTPSESITEMGVAYDVVAPPGSTNGPCYRYIYIDHAQGYTAASPETCVTNGQPLGPISTTTIISASRSNNTITYVTSLNTFAVGAVIFVNGMSDGTFNGYCNARTVTSTGFTCVTGLDTRYGASTSATGGIATQYNNNNLTFAPYSNGAYKIAIYRGASNAETLYHVFGILNIGSNAPDQMMWEDFGASMTSGEQFPYFLPTQYPTAPSHDSLIARVTAGGSTNTMTLSAPADSMECAHGGCGIQQDDMPALLAADALAGSHGGACFIPPTYFQAWTFNSYGNISHCNVIQDGSVVLNDTLQLTNVKWSGDITENRQAATSPSFSLAPHTQISPARGNPGLYLKDASLRGIAVTGAGNGMVCVLYTSGGSTDFQDDTFYCPGPLGVSFYDFDDNFAAAFGFHMFNVAVLGDGGAFAPAFISKNNGELAFLRMSGSRKGYFFGGCQSNGFGLYFDQKQEFQGPVTPLFTFTRCPNSGNVTTQIELKSLITDTGAGAASPGVAHLSSGANNGFFNGTLEIDGWDSPSVQGTPFGSVMVKNTPGGCYVFGQNVNYICENNGSGVEIHNTIYDIGGPSNVVGIKAGTIVSTSAPSVTVTTTCPASHGYPGFGSPVTNAYGVVWYDAVGGVTLVGPSSSGVVMNGKNQCAKIARPSPVPSGALCWSAYAVSSIGHAEASGLVEDRVNSNLGTPCAGIATPISDPLIIDETSYKDGSAPIQATAASSGIVPGKVFGQLVSLTESTEGQCFSSDSPADCGAFINGFAAIAAGASSVVVKTTSVTAKSQISLTFDLTQGTNLGVKCNTTAQQPYISARKAGISFTISVPSIFSHDPGCIGFHIKN